MTFTTREVIFWTLIVGISWMCCVRRNSDVEEQTDPPPTDVELRRTNNRVFHPPEWVQTDPTYNPDSNDPVCTFPRPEQERNAEHAEPRSQEGGVGRTEPLSVTIAKQENNSRKIPKKGTASVHSRFRKTSE